MRPHWCANWHSIHRRLEAALALSQFRGVLAGRPFSDVKKSPSSTITGMVSGRNHNSSSSSKGSSTQTHAGLDSSHCHYLRTYIVMALEVPCS
ncbi:hypothetical protein F4780DRAFT_718621 [Xylariomycetidae sp. FL0641]|nr:hypothetical protein F4780DRAFT_718621 [Xylariomycetidae sp. FL0641]